jgi:hypothetical protein
MPKYKNEKVTIKNQSPNSKHRSFWFLKNKISTKGYLEKFFTKGGFESLITLPLKLTFAMAIVVV